MIYKSYDNQQIKYWNNEFLNLFKCSKISESSTGTSDRPYSVDVKDEQGGTNEMSWCDIMSRKILLPIHDLDDQNIGSTHGPNMHPLNPLYQKRPISIENALIFGEKDRFYKIVETGEEGANDDDKLNNCEIVGLEVINIQYENVACSMIIFRNWTNNFKFQF